MLRPMLVLLSGLTANGKNEPPTEAQITLATVVEMVHMATLVHDDILDGAEIRRRGATINHLHGNEAAVLLGDYLISHAYHLCSSLDSQAFSRLIGHTTNVVCEGELTQNYNRRNWKLTEPAYYDIIYRKTAILTETCCRLGAMVSTERAAHIEAGSPPFGKKVGMAFQIIDDILDICGNQEDRGQIARHRYRKGQAHAPYDPFPPPRRPPAP